MKKIIRVLKKVLNYSIDVNKVESSLNIYKDRGNYMIGMIQ